MAELARDELSDVIELTVRVNALERRITDLTAKAAPSLPRRHRPDPGLVGQHRRSGAADPRSGNRQLNAAIHRIAVTQIRMQGLGKTYYEKKKSEGMSTPEALRCLKRRLVRVVFNTLKADHNTAQPTAGDLLPAAA